MRTRNLAGLALAAFFIPLFPAAAQPAAVRPIQSTWILAGASGADISISLDRSAFGLAAGEKLVVDLVELGSGDPDYPRDLQDQPAGSRIVRFGIYRIGAAGVREVSGTFATPVVVEVSAPAARGRDRQAFRFFYKDGADPKAALRSVAPLAPGQAATPGLRLRGEERRNSAGESSLRFTFDAWPAGDPYVVLPPPK